MKIRDLRVDDSWKALNGGKTIYEGYNMENVPENILSLEVVKMFACNDTLYIETREPEKELKKETVSGLFEDELAELFRELKKGDYIEHNNTCYYAKPSINYDGIIIKENEMFKAVNGKDVAYIGSKSLVNLLAHKTFTVCHDSTQNKKRMFYDAETEWIYTENFFHEMYEEYKEGEENPCTFEQFIKETIDFNGGIIEM